MPCNDGTEADYTKARVDYLTDMLCRTLKMIEAEGYSGNVDPAVLKWWEVHKEYDRQRPERERRIAEEKARRTALRRSAASKLTDAERRELGL